jgi:hypothetical protein
LLAACDRRTARAEATGVHYAFAMRAVWFTYAGAFLSLSNIAAGWSWALFDAELRLGDSGPQGIDWVQASVWLGVPAAVTIVLMAAAICRSRALLWVGAVAMAMLFIPCGGALLIDRARVIDGAGLAPWGWAAHLIGMCLALPAVITALWLYQRDTRPTELVL